MLVAMAVLCDDVVCLASDSAEKSCAGATARYQSPRCATIEALIQTGS